MELEVPCISAKSFALDIGDEHVCRFALKVVDEGLLAELKKRKSFSDVRPKINGSIFPIISDDTNKNVLKEQKRAQLLNPTTEISLTGWLIDGPNIPGRPFWVMRHRTPLLT